MADCTTSPTFGVIRSCSTFGPPGAASAGRSAERGNGLLIAAADDSDDLAALRTFAAERRLTYPIFRVEGGSAAPWGVKVFPASFYLDREGRIVTHQMGMTTRWSMRFWLWWAGRG